MHHQIVRTQDWFLLKFYVLNVSEGTKTYISTLCHFSTLSFEILPQVRQELHYHEFLLLFYCCVLLEIKLTTTTTTWSISWVLMSWRRKEPGHRQPWYLLCWTKYIRFPHAKGWCLVRYDYFSYINTWTVKFEMQVTLRVILPRMGKHTAYRWLSAKLQYFQVLSNWDAAVLH